MDINRTIQEKLDEIERKENVKILHCIESGSRAWGFESPDSDYDVRFVYVHDKDWYLSVDSRRDVIEWQLDETLDINGWDLKKVLQLLYKSNPTVFEWDKSPIVYRTTPEWGHIRQLLEEYFCPRTMVRHYLGIAANNSREIAKKDEVKLKKYFYVLRPLLACEWILDRNCPPPILFDELKDAYMPAALLSDVNHLLELKKSAPELGTGRRIDSLNQYIEAKMQQFSSAADTLPVNSGRSWDSLNDAFRMLVK